MRNSMITTPTYVERFHELCTKLQKHSSAEKSSALKQASWNIAIFAHAVKAKEFSNAIEHLDKLWNGLKEYKNQALEQEKFDQEAYGKLLSFTESLHKQYHQFVEKKNRI